MRLIKISPLILLILWFLSFIQIDVLAQTGSRVSISITPISSPKIQMVNSFELFWPVAAGRVMGDALYPAKQFKENLREKFIFGNFNKANYKMDLSVKRLLEAEVLYNKKDDTNAEKSLEASKTNIEKAMLLSKAQDKLGNIAELKGRFKSSLDKQKMLLEYLSTQTSGDQKITLDEQLEFVKLMISKLQ